MYVTRAISKQRGRNLKLLTKRPKYATTNGRKAYMCTWDDFLLNTKQYSIVELFKGKNVWSR